MNTENGLYIYRLRNVRVIDGDTVESDIDLGFGVTLHKLKIRLIGLNCPEVNTPEGIKAKTYTENWVKYSPQDDICAKIVERKDKYGRALGYVYNKLTVLNEELLAGGNAVKM